MQMHEAVQSARELWDASETIRVLPGPRMLHRVLELLDSLRLGRRRILDTVLAVTLSQAGVGRLATFNTKDYEVFDFLEIVDPRD
jgi:predicted nucleic acid-binding protein